MRHAPETEPSTTGAPAHGARELVFLIHGRDGERHPLCDLNGMPFYLSNGSPEFAETAHKLGAAESRLRCDFFPRDAHVTQPTETSVLRSVALGEPFFCGSTA